MAGKLGPGQVARINQIVQQLELGPLDLVTAVDMKTNTRIVVCGNRAERHKACSSSEAAHRPRGMKWTCDQHELCGNAGVANGRVALLWVYGPGQSEESVSEQMKHAVAEIAEVIGPPPSDSGAAPAHAFVGLPSAWQYERLMN